MRRTLSFCFVLFVMCFTYSFSEGYDDILYAFENHLQPIMIRCTTINADADRLHIDVDEQGGISKKWWPLISPVLTKGDTILDFDVSEARILIMLETNCFEKYLRVARWDPSIEDYTFVETNVLPRLTFLDSYHDGNAILLETADDRTESKVDTTTDEDDWEDGFDWLYMTFELSLDGSWYLTDFTDATYFFASVNNGQLRFFVFDDEDENDSSPEIWQTPVNLSLDNISFIELFDIISQFKQVYGYDSDEYNFEEEYPDGEVTRSTGTSLAAEERG